MSGKRVIAKPAAEIARTSGDGMEQETTPKNENKDCMQKVQTEECNPIKIPLNYKKISLQGQSPTVISGKPCKSKLQYLIPKIVSSNKKSELRRDRKPRFVPFEPYKCAVKPIIPYKNANKIKKNKNNLDINVLVTQMSNMKTSELNGPISQEETLEVKTEIEKEREIFGKEIEELKKEKSHFQAQLKFQVQVNSELKNLLVAAVGEDMQTKVHVLTEDKLQLARALLDTANNLSTHTEQIEFLAGQCEVWRSKFLASSVMVEELARWKADLTHKNSLLSKSNKHMLQLTAQIREMQIDLLKNLKFLANLKQLNLPSSNLVSIASECLNISQQMVLHSGIGMPDNLTLRNLETLTEAEKDAINALECVSQPLMPTDEALRAIVGQAFSSKLKETASQTTESDQS